MTGGHILTDSQGMKDFMSRITMVHQQVYIVFIAVFVFIVMIWKTFMNINIAIFSYTFYGLRKLVQLITVCFKRITKRIKCKL